MADSPPTDIELPAVHAIALSTSSVVPSPPPSSSSSIAPPPPHVDSRSSSSPSHTPPNPSGPRITTKERSRNAAASDDPGPGQTNESALSYRAYRGEEDLNAITRLVDEELSEPYNLYTYRHFLDQWPHLCFFALAGAEPIGVIICKQEPHTKSSRSLPVQPDGPNTEAERRPLMRGYLAMLSTTKSFRGKGIDEVVLETEADNAAALAFYAKMGFVREKRLYRFYLNGKDAYRLRLDLTHCNDTGQSA